MQRRIEIEESQRERDRQYKHWKVMAELAEMKERTK